jgi:hypothetical protein
MTAITLFYRAQYYAVKTGKVLAKKVVDKKGKFK